MKTLKIKIIGEANWYANFINDSILIDSLEDADIVFFTGGEDVDPSLYGCKKHLSTYSNLDRDLEEKEIFEKIRPDQFVVSVCRGSQFTCVMNGGILAQDCSGHAINRTHGITDGKTLYQITSTHHQMQYPFVIPDDKYTILFKAYKNLSGFYIGEKINSYEFLIHGEPEVVLYHHEDLPTCLAIQGHPEMMPDSPVSHYFNELIHNLVNEKNKIDKTIALKYTNLK